MVVSGENIATIIIAGSFSLTKKIQLHSGSLMENAKLHFFLVDDDPDDLDMLATMLTQVGHQVTKTINSEQALAQILSTQPDCVISDLKMPKIDGLTLMKQIRSDPSLIKQPRFIIITAKTFVYDAKFAFQQGVDGYIHKPINIKTVVNEILEIALDRICCQIWGIRGTLPVPGKKSVLYGGNTNCLSLNIAGKYFFIFDAGSGIKSLSDKLIKENKSPLAAHIFITHPHWDHINGLPFFAPLYIQGNEIDFYGPGSMDLTLEKILAEQMSSVYFPITTEQFAAKQKFHELKEDSFNIGEVKIQTILLNHPGQCLGYRVEYKNKVFCYITDNELYLKNSSLFNRHQENLLLSFIDKADLMAIDATYTDEVYPQRVSWGHSSVSRSIEVAHEAHVKQVYLHHHDPDQTDEDIKAKLATAQALLKNLDSTTRCLDLKEEDKVYL